MPLTNLKTLLDQAYAEKYAVGAFNVTDLYFLEAVLETAEQLESPVIINIAEVHLHFIHLNHLMAVLRDAVGCSRIPVAVNLDHGQTLPAVEKAISCGFTSIMFDGSKLPLDENIRQTRAIVDLCHPLNISVEAELGVVGGAEGGGVYGKADPGKYTDVEEAQVFVRETGIDALAVAIGNAHGRYVGKPELDFKQLDAIRAATGIPLVLHGGSGIPAPDFLRAVSLGISKINYFSGLAAVAIDALQAYHQAAGSQYNDYPLMMSAMKKRVAGEVADQIEIFGSAGKASTVP